MRFKEKCKNIPVKEIFTNLMVQNVHFFIELRDFFVFLRPQTKYYPQNEHFNGANIDHDSF